VNCRCACCGRRFQRRPQNPDQQYCSCKACQNHRRQRWRRNRLRSDLDYRGNQADSHKRWAQKHPDYWRQYRERHRDYVERNRRLQQGRDRLKRDLEAMGRSGAVLANSDACPDPSKVITVYYELLPAKGDGLANRYASKRLFQLIPVYCNDFVADRSSCKQTTRGTLAGGSGRPSSCPTPSP